MTRGKERIECGMLWSCGGRLLVREDESHTSGSLAPYPGFFGNVITVNGQTEMGVDHNLRREPQHLTAALL